MDMTNCPNPEKDIADETSDLRLDLELDSGDDPAQSDSNTEGYMPPDEDPTTESLRKGASKPWKKKSRA